jgi:hypothetical protein
LPYDPRSVNALKIAKEGWSMRDIIAHGDIDYHPLIVGPGVKAGAAHGFWIYPMSTMMELTPLWIKWFQFCKSVVCSTMNVRGRPYAEDAAKSGELRSSTHGRLYRG